MCMKETEPPTSTSSSRGNSSFVGTTPPPAATSANNNNTSKQSMRILICSENVPPQVNGIARRIGHYDDGLRNLGHSVELLHPDCHASKVWPHVNPWNFTAQMMVVFPGYIWQLLMRAQDFDVVHCVLPLNLSGMWVLAAFKLWRTYFSKTNGINKPTLIVSWHCNASDYIRYHAPKLIQNLVHLAYITIGCWMLPHVTDRILTPTRATDPVVTRLWNNEYGDHRAGVCGTGISLDSFHPHMRSTEWGKKWQKRKEACLATCRRKYLLVCVGRLSPEKGVHDLIHAMPLMKDVALWLIGDGPARPELELLAEQLKVPVAFWGYQQGEALYSAYTVADLFVCPSLTETFGQTVNEALAAEVRVALPSVPVFTEAYGEYVPADAFWEPHDERSMIEAIRKQLTRRDPLLDRSELKTWEQACEGLIREYEYARLEKHQGSLKKRVLLVLPFWWLFTFFGAIVLYIFALIRTFFGGSVRHFIATLPGRIRTMKKQFGSKQQQMKEQ